MVKKVCFLLFFDFYISILRIHTRCLPTATETENKVERGFLLDVVIGKRAFIFQLLSSKDESLLIRRDAFLVLDLLLHASNTIRGFSVKSDGLARESLDEDLHAAAETENKVKSRFLLDVVIRKGTFIFKLLSSKDQPLLIRRNAFLVLDLLLDASDVVRRFSVESNSLSSKSLYEDLHGSCGGGGMVQLCAPAPINFTSICSFSDCQESTIRMWYMMIVKSFKKRIQLLGAAAETQDQMERGLLLDIVV
jgi:hypothetical protein